MENKCLDGKRYRTRKIAIHALRKLQKKRTRVERVYKCPECGMYHLTSSKTPLKKKKGKNHKKRKLLQYWEDRKCARDITMGYCRI